jgi:hypothetical protein
MSATNGKYLGEEAIRDRQRGMVALKTLRLAWFSALGVIVIAVYLVSQAFFGSAVERLIKSTDRNTEAINAAIRIKQTQPTR